MAEREHKPENTWGYISLRRDRLSHDEALQVIAEREHQRKINQYIDLATAQT